MDSRIIANTLPTRMLRCLLFGEDFQVRVITFQWFCVIKLISNLIGAGYALSGFGNDWLLSVKYLLFYSKKTDHSNSGSYMATFQAL